MTFLADKVTSDDDESQSVSPLLAQPDEDASLSDARAERHVDARLQTALSSENLQKRLLRMFFDARTFEEEQGVSILYLALGFLKWTESPSSDQERFAPLLLIPVALNRQSAGAKFKLSFREDEVTTNLSLQAKLDLEFGIKFPDVPDVEDLSPSAYFDEVGRAVAGQKRWEVRRDDIVLWFFSFAKFLMYRDLDGDTWPADRRVDGHPIIVGLLDKGFSAEPPLCGEDDKIDGLIQPLDMVHVMDADSSQALALEEARRGRHLVVQGPPGTGKSQTIANMIAAAVKEGKRVLFVAEKMAALEVVKRRLAKVGLGDVCLELHSQKASKRAVLDSLAETLRLGRPKTGNAAQVSEELKAARDKLNAHADRLHTPLEPSGVSPFRVMGSLVRLRARGVPPADFELTGAARWTLSQRGEYVELLQDTIQHMKEIGPPTHHPWRGVMLDMALPPDIDRLASRLPRVIARLERLIVATRALAIALDVNAGDDASAMDSATVGRLGQRLAAAPKMDRRSMASDVWRSRRDEVAELVTAGGMLSECRAKLKTVVADVAWSADVSQARRHIAAHGRSWLRWFNRQYRDAQTLLRGVLRIDPPKSLKERLDILDLLMEGQRTLWHLTVKQGNDELGREAFGRFWRSDETDWAALAAIDEWERDCRDANIPASFRQVMAKLEDRAGVHTLVQQVGAELKPTLDEAHSLFQDLRLDPKMAFEIADLRKVPLEILKQRLEAWRDARESLTRWIAFRTRWSRLEAAGMAAIARELYQGQIDTAGAIDRFDIAYYEALLRQVVRQVPELAQFDGQSHERLLAAFQQIDLRRIDTAREQVARAHYDGLPQGELGVGELGKLRREIEKKRKNLPLRRLLKEAGHAVQAIKPVFMMSPISIAQFLEPGALDFDVLLIDEASQVQPVDALGAMARARQMIVVGDDKQLPPTRFFSKVLGDDDTTEDAEFSAADLESILGLCMAQGVARRMLRWHYRSHSPSLIAVSNHEFYGDRLYVPPSALRDGEEAGLSFRHVARGVFDRGKSATNAIEARAVAEAVIEHARKSPDKSLGVGAFSVAQRDAIVDELEVLRRQESGIEEFFATGKQDPFFVKNLENIQGDERDVIFISVGYARDASGHMAMTFGPLAVDGGERRLNVLITRARDRCVVFSSITADDIDLERARSRGAAALKTFLSFAQRRILDIAVPTQGGDYESEFEAQVGAALARYGYRIEPQVGIAGFRVDLAVVDPERPGRYLLGIECDGAMYHSSRSARDRDRLREAVLRDRGWIIHRVWSTDWFHRPEEQLRKAIAAIKAAKDEWACRDSRVAAPPPTRAPDGEIPRDSDTQVGKPRSSVVAIPYLQAVVALPPSGPVTDLPTDQLVQLVAEIIRDEGPIHADEIARRAVDLCGGKRTSQRSCEAVERALALVVRKAIVTREGAFYWPAGQSGFPVRNRADVASPTLRKPEMLPPREIQAALLAIIRSQHGATADDAIVEASRLLGYGATSQQLKAVLGEQVTALVSAQRLFERNCMLYAD